MAVHKKTENLSAIRSSIKCHEGKYSVIMHPCSKGVAKGVIGVVVIGVTEGVNLAYIRQLFLSLKWRRAGKNG